MQFASLSDRGNVRENNEDCCGVTDLGSGVSLCVLCDGMGGAIGGEIASRLALDTFTDSLRAAFSRRVPRDETLIQRAMMRACAEANRAVYLRATADDGALFGMGTTLVALLLCRNRFGFVLNVGDSRAYEITPAAARRVSHDHSLVQYLVDSGRITPEEAAVTPQRNIITRVIGTDPQVEPDVVLVDPTPLPGEKRVFLLCSDGLCDPLSDDEIRDVVLAHDDPNERARALLAAALAAGGRDNVTVVTTEF